MLILLSEHIAALRKQISDLEWNNPDDPALSRFRESLNEALAAQAAGAKYHPLF